MDKSPNLNLPFIIGSQAQKHVTHNEALRALDTLVQLSARDRNRTDPPDDAENGERFVVADGAGGLWEGRDHTIATYQDDAWAFFPPEEGFLVWVRDEEQLIVWKGTSWEVVSSGNAASAGSSDLLGVNTEADTTNRLSVKSDAVLFSHDDVTPGTGNVRLTLNKADVNDTASLIFQTGFSGRAEFGLTGSNNWHVRVSPDGNIFKDALIADAVTGKVSFPAGMKHGPTGALMSSFIPISGGGGETTLWRFDVPRTGIARRATLAGISGDRLTLASAMANQFFTNGTMENVSYVRIWNQSKNPEESAWVKRHGTLSELFVLDASDIAGWLAGDIIRLGEPGGGSFSQTVAVDISQMLQNRLGAVFHQEALAVTQTVSASGAGGLNGQIGVTPTGVGGSFTNTYSAGNEGGIASASSILSCSVPSPISNSNLLFVREGDNGTAALRIGAIICTGAFG